MSKRSTTTPNERKLTAALGELLACIEVDDLDVPASERTYHLEGFVGDAVRRANIAYGAAVRRIGRGCRYRVQAVRVMRDGRLENVSSTETLGAVHGRTHLTRERAEAVAADLDAGRADYGISPEVRYIVNEAP